MSSYLDFVNRALVLIGADPITGYDDGTSAAAVAATIYPMVLDDCLSRYPWRFLSITAQLAQVASTPAALFAYAYQLPVGVEHVHAIYVNDMPIEFDRADDKILCDTDATQAVIAEYTMPVDASRFPGYFASFLVFQLASALAIPVGDRNDLMTAYEQKASKQFAMARNADSRGRTARRMPVGRFRYVRNGGRSY